MDACSNVDESASGSPGRHRPRDPEARWSPAHLRLSLQFPGGALETTTEEITRGGFSVQGAGLAGDTTPFGFVVHLPDGQLSSGSATSSTHVQAHGTGFSCTFSAGEAAWTQFVDHAQNGAGLWQLISRLATRLDANTGDHLHVAPSMRLHTLGENAEACRIAFEKHPAEAPEVSTLSTSSPKLLELAQRTVSRLLTHDVLLKRSLHAEAQSVRLVELLKGGFGYVAHQDGGKLALMGLHGSELLVTEVDGASVFPFFTAEDLERIACDTLRLTHPEPRAPAPAPVEDAALRSDHFAAAYEHTAVDSRATVPCTREQLRAAMRASLRAQTRIYGLAMVRLFPDVWLEVRRTGVWDEPLRGFAMEYRGSLCLVVLAGFAEPRVVQLEVGDGLSLRQDLVLSHVPR